MTKKEIVRDICERANKDKRFKNSLTQLATKEIVQWTFEAIIETLVKEGRIELRNFGVFEVKQRKPRKAKSEKGAKSHEPSANGTAPAGVASAEPAAVAAPETVAADSPAAT